MNVTSLPTELNILNEIAHNLWWSWNQESWEIFEELNAEVWNQKRNPVHTLASLTPERLSEVKNNETLMQKVEAVAKKYNTYINNDNTWFNQEYADKKDKTIAYFSAEFGIHESLPIYSGGLGVLAGDHIKSSSDLGIPMTFVGLFYRNGYFTQQIDGEGQQVDVYDTFNPELLCVNPALDKNNEQVTISVNLPGREVKALVWEAKVGRNTLLLLDTHHESNTQEDKDLTARLYGGDREMRISQEVVLGIGGIRALNALGIEPDAYHMNEGHSGFFQLERVLNIMKEKECSFEEAKVITSSNCVFTTHTPVPAGNEAFSLPVMHKYFFEYIKQLDISWNRFLDLGLVEESSDYKFFSLTVFAINFSRFQNGVSELHGKIAAKMWKNQWENVPEIDNPMTHITNGVHAQTWTSLPMKELFEAKLGNDWEENLANDEYWNKFDEIDEATLKSTKKELKQKLIKMVRKQLKDQLERNGEGQAEIAACDSYLDENALTVGFARRFATYKRATLIFQDKKKLAEIVNNKDNPVQFVFAGKAHPADIPGQKFIKDIYQISREPEFKGKVIILENYDMNISRHMVSGVDVWLNNPRRPMEASGTSGQKVPLNGGLNFSVLDGWWREGHNGENGWTIGKEKDYPNDQVQDFEDANDFYHTLEQTIVPMYYQQHETWTKWIKNSLKSNIARYSTHRMVQDYMNKLYKNALSYGEQYSKDKFENVEEYITSRRYLRRNWNTITFENVNWDGQFVAVDSRYGEVSQTPSHHVEFDVDETLPGKVIETAEATLKLTVYSGEISAEQIDAELVVTSEKGQEVEAIKLNKETSQTSNGLVAFHTKYTSPDGTPRRVRVRLIPHFDQVASKFELGLVHWL
jgi:starch phosphorylase